MMKSDEIQLIQLCLHHVSFCAATVFAFCCALFTSVVTLSCIGEERVILGSYRIQAYCITAPPIFMLVVEA
jgi:hypothetical protein